MSDRGLYSWMSFLSPNELGQTTEGNSMHSPQPEKITRHHPHTFFIHHQTSAGRGIPPFTPDVASTQLSSSNRHPMGTTGSLQAENPPVTPINDVTALKDTHWLHRPQPSYTSLIPCSSTNSFWFPRAGRLCHLHIKSSTKTIDNETATWLIT